jgi:D-glycerate 3-kinase
MNSSSGKFPAFLSQEMGALPPSVKEQMKDILVRLYPTGVTPSAHIVERQASDYYLPVYCYLRHLLKNKNHDGPLMVGISAPQGSGKTTLTDLMQTLLKEQEGVDATVMSLDDFYLTAEDQSLLRAKHDKNPLLELRGNAGSHDIPLMMDTVQSLSKGQQTVVPRYDKSVNGGKGDRASPDAWVRVDSPPTIVLFEGWMLGFNPVDPSACQDTAISEVNTYLDQYSALHSCFDGWLVVGLTSMDLVYKWREHAESVMRASGKGGMSEDEVRDFVDRYMPAYQHYLPGLYATGPGSRKKVAGNMVDTLMVTIDENRMPVAVETL